jgi:hypothetical protein
MFAQAKESSAAFLARKDVLSPRLFAYKSARAQSVLVRGYIRNTY